MWKKKLTAFILKHDTTFPTESLEQQCSWGHFDACKPPFIDFFLEDINCILPSTKIRGIVCLFLYISLDSNYTYTFEV